MGSGVGHEVAWRRGHRELARAAEGSRNVERGVYWHGARWLSGMVLRGENKQCSVMFGVEQRLGKKRKEREEKKGKRKREVRKEEGKEENTEEFHGKIKFAKFEFWNWQGILN